MSLSFSKQQFFFVHSNILGAHTLSMVASCLPDDLWRAALTWLAHEDILSMSATSKLFRRMLQLPPFHRAWQTLVIDSSRTRWSHATRSHPDFPSIPRVLMGNVGVKLHVIRLGHRLYPHANPCFGDAQLKLVAAACPILHTLHIFYRSVVFSLSGLTCLIKTCLLLKDVAIPFGSSSLRRKLFDAHAFQQQELVTLSPSWVTTLRLHNMEDCCVKKGAGAGYVPELFGRSLTSLRLVNVKNLLNLDFLTSLPLLRHLTVKHCRRPVGFLGEHVIHTPTPWIFQLSPQLQSFVLVDADHVVCEQMVLRYIFGNAEPRAFAQLSELSLDEDIMSSPAAVYLNLEYDQLVCDQACVTERHAFRSWIKCARCTRCCASGPPKLRKLKTICLYNKDHYALHDTL